MKSTFCFTPTFLTMWLFTLLLMPLPVMAATDCQPWTDKHSTQQKPLFIADINIIPANIFKLDDPEQDSKIHHLMNRLHSVTKPEVIQRKLLFKTGERYDPARLAESERLLRAVHYIKDAEIYPQQVCGDRVMITVRTTDNWTLTPGVSFGRSGGNNRFGIKVEEQNLFGWGKSLSLAYKQDYERDSFQFHYGDDQLFNTRRQLNINLDSNSDGHSYRLGLAEPFYAIDTPESWYLNAEDSSGETGVYRQGTVAETFTQDVQALDIAYAWNNHVQGNTSARYQLGWHHEQTTIQSLANADNHVALNLSYPWVGFEYLEDTYLELENLNTMGRIEDTAIGRRFTIKAGVLTTALGSDSDQLKLSTRYRDSFISTDQQLGQFDFETTAYLGEGQLSGYAAKLEARYHYFLNENSTLFLKSAVQVADNLLPHEQYRLGSLKNLRGYPEGFQAGDKSALFTAEYRYFFEKSPYQLVKFGAAAFADIGTAWGQGNDPDWIKNVGVGLRLVPTRSSSASVVHVDLAVPLDTQNGIEDMQFTIGTKTTF